MDADERGARMTSAILEKMAVVLGIAAIASAAPARIVHAAQGVAVSGQITTQGGKDLTSATVTIARDDAAAAAAANVARFLPDGRFIFSGVQPGRYVIRARAETDPRGVTLFATYRVMVEDRDVANLTMTLERGAVLTGSLERRTVRGTKAPDYSALRVRAPLNDGSSFGDALTGHVDRSGRFSIRGLIPGTHAISVEGLSAPWLVEKITLAGKDITNLPLQVDGRTELRDVRITIADVAPAAERGR